MIEGQTNVTSQRVGRGACLGVGEDVGRFVVTTMEVPWSIARDRIGGDPLAVQLVDSMEFSVVDEQIEALPACDTVLRFAPDQP